MDKKSLSFCFQIILACLCFAGLVVFAYQKPKIPITPLYTPPYTTFVCEAKEHPVSAEASPSTFLDASPLFLATPLNASCLPPPKLTLSLTLPLEDVLEPILSLSQNFKVLPLQQTIIEDPLALILYEYPILLYPPEPPSSLKPIFCVQKDNTQILNLLNGQRSSLSLDWILPNLPLALLEGLDLLILRDCTGYTLPVLKRNTLGYDTLDQSILDALSSFPAPYASQATAYEEYKISL